MFYEFRKYHAMYDISLVCYLAKNIFCQVFWSLAFVCLSHDFWLQFSSNCLKKKKNLCGGDWPKMATLNFGEDLDPDPTTKTF